MREWPWWEDYNEGLRELAATGHGSRELLSPEICALLEDVDAAFARSDPPPGWPEPRPFGVAPQEDEYSRCLFPGKFVIVVARVQAWKSVLLERGWATESASARWALPPFGADGVDGVDTVLRPRDGAQPLVLTIHTPVSQDHPHSVTIGAGDPAVELTTVPDCGCDACDSGSDSLLEEIDQWALSVVNDSLEVEVSAASHSARTSFGSCGSSPAQAFREAWAFTAEPWAEGWMPRPL